MLQIFIFIYVRQKSIVYEHDVIFYSASRWSIRHPFKFFQGSIGKAKVKAEMYIYTSERRDSFLIR